MRARQPDRDLYLTARAHPAQRVRSSAHSRHSAHLVAMSAPGATEPAGAGEFRTWAAGLSTNSHSEFQPECRVEEAPIGEQRFKPAQREALLAAGVFTGRLLS
jgi:hypothetical protein